MPWVPPAHLRLRVEYSAQDRAATSPRRYGRLSATMSMRSDAHESDGSCVIARKTPAVAATRPGMSAGDARSPRTGTDRSRVSVGQR